MIWNFDFESDIPLYIQIKNQVVLSISKGELSIGDKLPTVRALSEESGINAMTITKAYQILKSEGYVKTDRRSGTVVSARKIDKDISQETRQQLELIFAQLKVQGIKNEKIISLCKDILEENK